jgi:hypothetical protein
MEIPPSTSVNIASWRCTAYRCSSKCRAAGELSLGVFFKGLVYGGPIHRVSCVKRKTNYFSSSEDFAAASFFKVFAISGSFMKAFTARSHCL